MSTEDTIGVVRHHRWMGAEVQAAKLESDGCRVIVSLGGGRKHKIVGRDQLERLARPGTVIKLVWAFLLADTEKRHAHVLRIDLTRWMKRLIDGRGAVIKDVDMQLTTANPGHRKAIIAVADDMIVRHCKGAKSALISEARKGRPQTKFTEGQLKDAKAIWRNLKDYPHWIDAEKALAQIVDAAGYEFTTARAFVLWKGRR